MPHLSVVLCTRDPAPALLARSLPALGALRTPAGWTWDGVIVDNASTHPLEQRDDVRAFVDAHARWRVVQEPRPGLANAREAGARGTPGDPVVWFDDDNVPDAAYLEGVASIVAREPDALVFGAARITVEYVGDVSAWSRRHAPAHHLARDDAERFSRERRWTRASAFGAGLVTRRAAIAHWMAGRAAGRYTLDGRTGSRLGAGEDAEIQFAAVEMGGTVGVSRALALTHVIPARRTGARYLARLAYGTSGAVHVARAEVFGREALDDSGPAPTPMSLARIVAATAARHGPRAALVAAGDGLGSAAGLALGRGRTPPAWVRAAVAVLGLD